MPPPLPFIVERKYNKILETIYWEKEKSQFFSSCILYIFFFSTKRGGLANYFKRFIISLLAHKGKGGKMSENVLQLFTKDSVGSFPNHFLLNFFSFSTKKMSQIENVTLCYIEPAINSIGYRECNILWREM